MTNALRTWTFLGRDDNPMFWNLSWQVPKAQHGTREHLAAVKSQCVLGSLLRVQRFAGYRQAVTFRIKVCHRIWYFSYGRSLEDLSSERSFISDCKYTTPFCSLAARSSNLNQTGEPMLDIVICGYLLWELI